MPLTIIDLEALCKGLPEKIEGFAGITVVTEDEEGFGFVCLIETSDGWDWKEISNCTRKGAKKKLATVSELKH